MKRTDWILGIGLAILLLAILAFGLLFWQQSRLDLALTPIAPVGTAVPINNSSITGETSLIALARAQQIAENWQTGAQLVNASASWPLNAQPNQLQDGIAEWSFTFYDATTNTVADISVVSGKASLSRTYTPRGELRPLRTGGWQVNSDKAIAIFMENGGSAFYEREGQIVLFARLSTVETSGRMEWLIAAVSEITNNSLTMWIDATSGEILDSQDGF